MYVNISQASITVVTWSPFRVKMAQFPPPPTRPEQKEMSIILFYLGVVPSHHNHCVLSLVCSPIGVLINTRILLKYASRLARIRRLWILLIFIHRYSYSRQILFSLPTYFLSSLLNPRLILISPRPSPFFFCTPCPPFGPRHLVRGV